MQNINLIEYKVNLLRFGCLQIFDRLLINFKAIFTYAVYFFDAYKDIQLRF